MKKILGILLATLFTGFVLAQDGKILAKKEVDLSQIPIWSEISANGKLKPDFEYLNHLSFYTIIYQSDSIQVEGIYVEPKAEGKYPVVIFNRGGHRKFAPLTIPTMILYVSKLADQGYVVIGSNYRENDEFGGAEIKDVLNLTETVKEIKNARPDCIGMYGWSRGGMMTYLALKESGNIKTAIVGNGPSDLFGVIAERPEMETKVMAVCIPNYITNKQKELEKRSAQYWAGELNKTSSLLILCGTKDDRVNPSQSSKMAEKLAKVNYDVSFKQVDTDHYFSDKKTELNEIVIKWFDEKLKNTGK